MNFLVLWLLLIGSALGVNPQDALIAKANQVVSLTEQALVEYRKADKAHLLHSIERIISTVKTDVNALKSDIAHHKTAAQLKADDDRLTYHESRLSDELIILRDYLAHPPKHDVSKVANIINVAKALVTKAHNALAHDKVPAHQIVHADITYEIGIIQQVIGQLGHKPAAAQLEKEIESLERNELSLRKLLTRIAVH